jgi:putative heme-binding domain-containing protein
MSSQRHLCLLSRWATLVWALTFNITASAADPFAEGVRTTPWQKPEEEQRSFHLPPGFEIQLVAAEPDINKPLNLAFDVGGRLWVTTSIEYPYAAPTNRPARDRLMIFEDFGPDGRARKVTEFAGGLNIPIGIYPFYSQASDSLKRSSVDAFKRAPGVRPNNNAASTLQPFHASTNSSKASTNPGTWKCIVWSIPNIWLFEDTDSDGKADKREVLYGPFDCTRDTHGNQASFRRGFDGWLYCTHGYNNDSHVKGRDTHQVDLNSGNTYRIRLDGSRIEHYTHGQVNPFGLAFDPQGNLFSSDCHSAPIYQLLAGAYYPSFGKPDDGLGFAPTMMSKPRGSTALDGISYYGDDLWPEEFRENIFIGDVMTSRIYRDRAVEEGATKTAKPLPDFVTTDDPWFRPVDTQLGPDGAFYIADFYNRIIGHYEVPLTHPGRDRTSGRIWRVVKSKTGVSSAPPAVQTAAGTDETSMLLWPPFDFSKAPLSELLAALAHPNLSRRMLAMNALFDRFRDGAKEGTRRALSVSTNTFQTAHLLWLLDRLEALDDQTLVAHAKHPEALVRTHSLRIITERGRQRSISPRRAGDRLLPLSLTNTVIRALSDPNALVQRCAAEALGAWPSFDHIRPLLNLRQRVPGDDTHLLYVVRQALRDQLVPEENFQRLAQTELSPADIATLAEIAIAVKSPSAATFLLRHLPALSQTPKTSPAITEILKHAARYAPESELNRLASFANDRLPNSTGSELMFELGRQFSLFKSVSEGLQQRGVPMTELIRDWGTNIVRRFFVCALGSEATWMARPLDENPAPIPWDTEERSCADGNRRRLTSSLPHGEHLTGTLRSVGFILPASLSFWLCGHNGFPEKPDHRKNVVRLRDAQTMQVLAEAFPPRSDTAKRVTWDLSTHQGKRGYVEVIDADTGGAYAWLAFGGFEPDLPPLRPSDYPPRKATEWVVEACDLAAQLQIKELSRGFGALATPPAGVEVEPGDYEIHAALARAWAALDPVAASPGLAQYISAPSCPPLYREGLGVILAEMDSPAARTAVAQAMSTVPYRVQQKWAMAMTKSRDDANAFLGAIEQGLASPRLLQSASLRNRLQAAKVSDWESRVARLTRALPPSDEAREKLMAQRRAAFATAQVKPDGGQQVFAKNCASCHRIGGEGALIGPQLDGIGTRGLERICEDVLDPNRNVDRAFRTTLLTLKDGDIVSGLFRREEGELVVLADSTGREISIPKNNIAERQESDVSLMPENFGDLLSQGDFNSLMAFLLAKGSAAAK